MVEKTSEEAELSPADAAARLRRIADEIEREDGSTVEVGNKRISLSPASTVSFEIDVRERSSILGGDRESIQINLDWKPK